MNRKNLKRSNKISFVRYTLLWGVGACLLFICLSKAQAQQAAFEDLVVSLRDPFLINVIKKPLPKKENVPQPFVIDLPVVIAPLPTEPVVKPIPKVAPRPKLPKMTVTGLIFKTKHPQAIINGVVLGPGDALEGVKIHKIKEGGLLVEYSSNIYFIKYSNK